MKTRRREPQKVGNVWIKMKFFIYIVCQAFSQTHREDEKLRCFWRLCHPISPLKTESAKADFSEVDLVGFSISERRWHKFLGCLFQCLTTLTERNVCLRLQAIACFHKGTSLIYFSSPVASFDKPKLPYWKRQWAVISCCSLMILIFQTLPHHIPRVISFPGWLHLHYSTIPPEKIFHTTVINFFFCTFPLLSFSFQTPKSWTNNKYIQWNILFYIIY